MIEEMARFTVALPRPLVEKLDKLAREGYRNRTQQLQMILQKVVGEIGDQERERVER